MSCNFNGIFDCDVLSVSGIKKVFLIKFGELYDFTYDNNDLGKITDFKAYSLPIEYKTINGSFTENLVSNPTKYYTHDLSFSIPKMDKDKRNDFEKLISNKLSIIFQDKNNKCWIIGFDKPIKTSKFSASTGGDANIYSISFSGISNYPVKELNCFISDCFVSFNGSELRNSTFLVENASIYDFSGLWQITSDITLLDYTPFDALDPVNWSNPTILNRDKQNLIYLIGNPSANITLTYDNTIDVATIEILSPNTTYNNLSFNNQIPFESDIQVWLNLSIVYNPTFSTSIITITDSLSNIVYSGLPLDVVVGTGLNGIVSNANVNVSTLYPNGTTFTATLSSSQCEEVGYDYVYEPFTQCSYETECGYYLGKKYSIEIPKNTIGPAHRFTTLNFDEYQFNIINNIEWDFSNFETNTLYAFNSYSTLPIINSSILVEDLGSSVKISFESTRNNGKLTALVDLDGSIKSLLGYSQTTLMNVSSIVNSDSKIKIFDVLTNELSGFYGQLPIVNTGNTYKIEEIDNVSVGTMDSIAFDVNDYAETDPFYLNISSPSCPSTGLEYDNAVCYDTRDLIINRNYYKYEFDASITNLNPSNYSIGYTFFFDFNLGATNYYIPIVLSLDLNSLGISYSEFIENINFNLPLSPSTGDKPIKILGLHFDFYNRKYVLELDVEEFYVINNIEIDAISSNFSYVEDYPITEVQLNPLMNPNTIIRWQFTDITSTAIDLTALAKSQFVLGRETTNTIADLTYISATGYVNLNATYNDDYVSFDFYKNPDLLVAQIGLATYTTSISYDLVSQLTSNGYTIGEVNYIVFVNSAGVSSVIPFDVLYDSDTLLNFDYKFISKNVWGRFDSFRALTPAIFTPIPEITSTLCP